MILPFFVAGQYHYVIEGQFDTSLLGEESEYSVQDGDFMVLKFSNIVRSDTVLIQDKKFRLEGEVEIPAIAMLNLYIKKIGWVKGVAVELDNCHYFIKYAQKKLDDKRYSYETEIDTDSKFYTFRSSTHIKKAELTRKKEELNNLIENSTNDYERMAYGRELKRVEQELFVMYDDIAKIRPATHENTFVLLSAPDFSYDRYIEYYDALSDEVKNSHYGKIMYKKLLETKPKQP